MPNGNMNGNLNGHGHLSGVLTIGAGGGSDVEITPTLQSGTKIADFEIDGVQGELYAPNGGGAFIDTNRVIQASTNIPANTDVTYTATEDCCLEFILVADTNQGVHVTIDGVYIKTNFISSGIYTWGDIVYLRRGQTIKMRQSYTASDGSYTVYGLTFGTNNIFTPRMYSLEEREVGVWIDGSTVYEKTIDLGSNRNFNNGWQSIIPHNNQYNMVFKGGLINESGLYYQLDIACNDATYIEGYFTHNSSGRFLSFQYTKNE